MANSLHSLFGLWRERRRRLRTERALRATLTGFNDHFLKDIGYQPRKSADDPWM